MVTRTKTLYKTPVPPAVRNVEKTRDHLLKAIKKLRADGDKTGAEKLERRLLSLAKREFVEVRNEILD